MPLAFAHGESGVSRADTSFTNPVTAALSFCPDKYWASISFRHFNNRYFIVHFISASSTRSTVEQVATLNVKLHVHFIKTNAFWRDIFSNKSWKKVFYCPLTRADLGKKLNENRKFIHYCVHN